MKVNKLFVIFMLLFFVGCSQQKESDDLIDLKSAMVQLEVDKNSEIEELVKKYDSDKEKLFNEIYRLKDEVDMLEEDIAIKDKEVNQKNEEINNLNHEIDDLRKMLPKETQITQIIEDKNLSDIRFLKNLNAIVFSIETGEDSGTYLYDLKTQEVVCISIYDDIYWSKTGENFFVDEGTDGMFRDFVIVIDETSNSIKNVEYAQSCFWLDGESIIYSEFSDTAEVEPKGGLELDRSVNIVVYNVKTKEKEVLLYGTKEVAFFAIGMNEEGKLRYSKYDFEADEYESDYLTIDE